MTLKLFLNVMNMSCFFAFINSWSLFIACVGVKTSLQSLHSKLLQVSNMSHPLKGGMIRRSVTHLQSYMCHSQRGNTVSWQLWVTNGCSHVVCWQWYLNKIYRYMTYIIHNNNYNRLLQEPQFLLWKPLLSYLCYCQHVEWSV